MAIPRPTSDPATEVAAVSAAAEGARGPAESQAVSRSPAALFARELRKSPVAVLCAWILALMYVFAVLADFLSPYSFETQDEEHPFHPPSAIHIRDDSGRFTWPPYVRATEIKDITASQFHYVELKEQRFPLKLFVQGDPYRWFGLLPSRLHFFGVDDPGRIFLLGSEQFGRDIFTRLLFGARISLSIGLVGVLLSFVLGLTFGGIAGYFSGWVDTLIMRVTEVLMTIPGLYLILALRAMFPVNMPSTRVYLRVVVILSFVSWAGLARVVRGMVLSIRSREYVLAAQALGVGPLRIIARHILPNTFSYIIVAATVSIPGYILGEVALSFLGVGIQEPNASWGNMLRQAQNVDYLRTYPWVLVPGVAIFLAVMSFNFLGDGLRDALDPRRVSGSKV